MALNVGMYLRDNGKVIVSRLIPYWLISLAAAWILTYFYMDQSEIASDAYEVKFADKLFKTFEDEKIVGYGPRMVGFVIPMLFAASVTAFLLTNTPLPTWRFSWANKLFASIRRFRKDDAEYGRQLAKKNQFALGEPNFNMLAFWFVLLPNLIIGVGMLPLEVDKELGSSDEPDTILARENWLNVSEHLGWASVVAMTFFLIPVARHSVLLTALGWSPIQALRFHILAGHLAFAYAAGHAVTMCIVFGYDKISLRDQMIPKSFCWGKGVNFTQAEDEPDPPLSEDCEWQWINLTGTFAFLAFMILWGTSVNWVRRANYRLFYVCHVIFGTLMLLATFLHFDFTGVYMLPSTAYYIASTAPTLIQSLASRFRGGNKIVRVVKLQDAGGCVEVHVAADNEADSILKNETCLYVKLCVPKISLIWHPFTVYRHTSDNNIVRILFRPVGPFTKDLAMHLTAAERPVTILDGFYRGSDRVAHSLHHDHVSIITGGVAVTPFLSFIPRLLHAISQQPKDDRLLNSVTFHWAIRESGLEAYVIKEFLRGMMAKANEIEGFTFDVIIHRTGRKAMATLSKDVESISDSELAEKTETFSDETSSGSDSAELMKEDVSVDSGKEHVKSDAPGFAMSVARTMPARFFKMHHNLPYAAGFVGFMWLGVHLTFTQYSYRDDNNFASVIGVAWYTILFVLLSIVYGTLVEGAELLYRKYFPSPMADTFILEDGRVTDAEKVAAELFESSNMTVRDGRPHVDLLLSAAKQASAPGIFLCGPTAMCESVYKEVRKENSFLGLTRYCIYDEPFEM